ncbi:sugar (and other) transporter [Cordyceps javanica]|uniref:Sugar (And other) transporter n=1 Tax=Cordyceps javanica TaxID=43265 RepID=A0A545VD93_9HYPO|nr:sugar (and other) transporter [Cordyceps javanica]TQW10637.1 sugar (and other) transporter [Cordyceps javanica]
MTADKASSMVESHSSDIILSETIERPSKGGSLQDKSQGADSHQLTHFERKAALINDELDKLGFGKYQKCIWLLCGFGYFLDLTWAQGIILMATAIFQEMNVSAERQGLMFTCGNAGLAVGAFTFGITSDKIGRKWVFSITCLITCVFGMLLAAVKFNYGAICGIYFLACIGLGGNIPINATIALEFMPPSKRYLVSLLSMFQPIGVVVASVIAYGTAAKYRCDATLPACVAVGAGEACCTVSSNMGWRYLVIVIGSITLSIFLARYLLFRFHESPKFLVAKGREQDAIVVLDKIARFNGATAPTVTIEDFRDIDRSMGVVAAEKASPSDARGIIGNYWSFNLAGAFLPIILLRNHVDDGANSVSDTYLQYVYIYLPGILGAVIALFSVQMPLLGRKWSLVVSATLQGLAMAMYTQVKNTAGFVGLNAFEYIMQTYFNSVLYASAPELFDTTYRASASGMLSSLGRIAGIIAPIAGQKYIAAGASGVLWLGAGGIWLSAILMVFLPVEMRDKQMY